LPWPTERGVVTGHFGTHDHPVFRGIKVNNDGIDISTARGEQVRAVFEGIVTRVHPDPVDPNVKIVIILHGNYRTVYANLVSVSVRAGQQVTTRQPIGVVNTRNDATVLKFQIWRDMQKLNPAQWLAPHQ
jgi:murein DD-endopeptidase MepM/ murein hydrolase activator NlpD